MSMCECVCVTIIRVCICVCVSINNVYMSKMRHMCTGKWLCYKINIYSQVWWE